jgi:hypothetical protein
MMRTALTAGACAWLVVTATSAAMAQTEPAQQPGNTVTVVGCVQQPHSGGSLGGTPLGTTAPPNQAGDRANSPIPDPGFILSGARLIDKPGANGARADATTASPAPTGTAGDASDSKRSQPLTYALVGKEQELAGHVGHTVEISGVVAAPPEPQRPIASPEPVKNQNTGADPVGKAFQSGVRQLRIVRMTMTGSSCPQPQ